MRYTHATAATPLCSTASAAARYRSGPSPTDGVRRRSGKNAHGDEIGSFLRPDRAARLLPMAAGVPTDELAAHIVVVDDDRDIRQLLSDNLTDHGYHVSMAANTRELDQLIRAGTVDLVILDVMMPGEDGIDACRRLRRDGGPPVIFLSALAEEGDRILGLDIGASHYLPKPCSTREVLATVRAALRTRQVGSDVAEQVLMFVGWRMDLDAWELTDPEGVLIDLTDGEFAVLRSLVERPRRVLSREQLLEGARGPDTDSFDRAIDVQISRLRRKLRAPSDDIIRTVRNEGYMFVPTVTRR